MGEHILFLCTGNICRSPLAEGMLKHKLAEKRINSITVSSAGTFGLSGQPADDLAVEAAARHGIDIADHVARQITREMLEGADMIVCAEFDHVIEAGVILADTEGKFRLLSDFGPPEGRDRDIEDPYGEPIDAFMSAYDCIEECVDGLLDTLTR